MIENQDDINKRLERIENLLRHSKIVFNINEVSSFTGLSKSSIYKMTCKGLIPHYKKAKHLYFDRREVENWLRSERGYSQGSIEQKAINYLVND